MANKTWTLTRYRKGFNDKTKEFKYAKAANDAFDRMDRRLADRIVLTETECFRSSIHSENVTVVVREWVRGEGEETIMPRRLFNFGPLIGDGAKAELIETFGDVEVIGVAYDFEDEEDPDTVLCAHERFQEITARYTVFDQADGFNGWIAPNWTQSRGDAALFALLTKKHYERYGRWPVVIDYYGGEPDEFVSTDMNQPL